jgi:hypothetical protein
MGYQVVAYVQRFARHATCLVGLWVTVYGNDGAWLSAAHMICCKDYRDKVTICP